MAYLASKDQGDSSMPLKRNMREGMYAHRYPRIRVRRGETGTVESEFLTMTPTSVAAYLKRRRWRDPVDVAADARLSPASDKQ